MATVSKVVISLAKLVMPPEQFPVVPATASAQHRAPTAADRRLEAAPLSFFFSPTPHFPLGFLSRGATMTPQA